MGRDLDARAQTSSHFLLFVSEVGVTGVLVASSLPVVSFHSTPATQTRRSARGLPSTGCPARGLAAIVADDDRSLSGSARVFMTEVMSRREFLDIDPRTLRLPPSRLQGADPYKLQVQVARFGQSTVGMPALEVYRGSDGEL